MGSLSPSVNCFRVLNLSATTQWVLVNSNNSSETSVTDTLEDYTLNLFPIQGIKTILN